MVEEFGLVSGFTRGFPQGEAVCAEAEIRQTMAFVKPNHERSEVCLIALLPFSQWPRWETP